MTGPTPAPLAVSTVTQRPIPRLRELPWIGAPWKFLRHPGAYLLQAHREHGDVFRFSLFGRPMIGMLGPEANRTILASQRERFSHAIGYELVTPILGDGLLFQDGEVHQRNRRLMTPAFHARGIRRYFDVMHDCATRHLATWAEEGRQPMYDRFRHLTFEVMARLILGVEEGEDLGRLETLNARLARGATSFPRLALPFTPYGAGVAARRELTAYLGRVIRRRRERADTAGDDDALGLLMAARDEEGSALGDDELASQSIILMFAGHDTTMSMLTSAVMSIVGHPRVRERLIEEQRRVVGSAALRVDHLREFTYMDAVLKEVERLYPPISLNLRGVVEDVDFRGFHIPAGSIVTYCCWATHRMPEVFRDPERFDPERFLEPRSEHRRHPYALVGFGGGARLCIGRAFSLMEMQITLSHLLRHYFVELATTTPSWRYIPTLRPACGLPGTITRVPGEVEESRP